MVVKLVLPCCCCCCLRVKSSATSLVSLSTALRGQGEWIVTRDSSSKSVEQSVSCVCVLTCRWLLFCSFMCRGFFFFFLFVEPYSCVWMLSNRIAKIGGITRGNSQDFGRARSDTKCIHATRGKKYSRMSRLTSLLEFY